MGEVYEGTSSSGEPCAVKLLHLHLVSDRNHYARFVRETRIAASLTVANVVRVLESSDENAVLPYLVMERLIGEDLGAHLGKVIKLPPRDVLELVSQIAGGVDAAHAVGIVHRDLKPQNIFRAEAAQGVVWKVLDFGVSKLLDQNATLSQGVVVGTPQYMAPEQARGEVVDVRADFYSLALITYRALTGRPAFIVSDVRALLAVVSSRMPPRPSDMLELPTEVDDVIAVAMSKDPRDRFASARAFSEALSLAFEGRIDPEIGRRAQEVLARWPWDDPAREAQLAEDKV
jgi:serine/threonine protein kinase